jgi:hypothetical protein
MRAEPQEVMELDGRDAVRDTGTAPQDLAGAAVEAPERLDRPPLDQAVLVELARIPLIDFDLPVMDSQD